MVDKLQDQMEDRLTVTPNDDIFRADEEIGTNEGLTYGIVGARVAIISMQTE